MHITVRTLCSFFATRLQKEPCLMTLLARYNGDELAGEFAPSTFTRALILSCLTTVPKGMLPEVELEALAKHLLTQLDAFGSANYWQRESEIHVTRAYPDDLDTTASVIAAVQSYNSELVTADTWANFVRLLTAVEVEPGGPYTTWLVAPNDKERWYDIDPVVNANISFLLNKCDVHLDPLDAYLTRAIPPNGASSRYYHTRLTRLYFLARAVRSKEAKMYLREALLAEAQHDFTPLQSAFFVSAGVRAGLPAIALAHHVATLERAVESGQAMLAYPCWIDRITDGETFYAGSAELTAAFCIEALVLFTDLPISAVSQPAETFVVNTYQTQILANARARFTQAGKDVALHGVALIQQLSRAPHARLVATITHDLAVALISPPQLVPEQTITALDLANTYGWTAYTIYDDFLDNEGNSAHLSVANICLRELTHIFTHILPEQSFAPFFHQVMDLVDDTNTWEVQHCRLPAVGIPLSLPDYGDYIRLAYRSWGAILAPVGLLRTAGYTASSPEVAAIQEFFFHYFIARQLNDDMHDWEDDLALGQLTSVSTKLLERYPYPEKLLSLHDALPELRRIFWYDVVEQTCNDVLRHVTLAEQTIDILIPIMQPTVFTNLLRGVRGVANVTLAERKRTTEFLAAYGRS